MAKIFQLELFIKEMSIWKFPHNSADCDETCVDVTVFNIATVPINGFVFGKNSTMNRGQNFLFTLNAMPTDDIKVLFNVSKRAYNRPKNFLGTGNIPINNIFSDIFSQTFNDTNNHIAAATQDGTIKKDGNNSPDSAQDANPSQFSPMSRLSKAVYPIIGADSNQWGTVCILMRLTSFGDFSAHPIHIHQSHKEIILQQTPNTAIYKCIPLDDLRENKQNAVENFGYCKKHPPINCCTDVAQSNHMNCNCCDSDLCPCPPASPKNVTQYDEFKAEVNDNVLCVRMPKNGGVVRRIYDSGDLSANEDHSGNVYSDHIRKIPIIRGNRKYPAHYGEISSFPGSCMDNNLVYDNREKVTHFGLQCNENRILNANKISCPSDVQIVTKNNDPKRDVFLLTIGKDSSRGQNGIQLEMKTPKNLLARSMNKFTTSVQTFDDEFVGQVKKGKAQKSAKKNKK